MTLNGCEQKPGPETYKYPVFLKSSIHQILCNLSFPSSLSHFSVVSPPPTLSSQPTTLLNPTFKMRSFNLFALASFALVPFAGVFGAPVDASGSVAVSASARDSLDVPTILTDLLSGLEGSFGDLSESPHQDVAFRNTTLMSP